MKSTMDAYEKENTGENPEFGLDDLRRVSIYRVVVSYYITSKRTNHMRCRTVNARRKTTRSQPFTNVYGVTADYTFED
jgi:hypothetical protein